MSVNSDFRYDVSDINNKVRKTNALLRAVNNIRNLVNDLKDLFERPTAAKFFWTIIQISRTYTGIRRLMRMVSAEVKIGAMLGGITPPNIIDVGEDVIIDVIGFDLSSLSVRVEAFKNELPMPINGIDISNIPEKTMELIQRILEEDAEETVADAKAILNSRIIAEPNKHTGFLESNIYWQPISFGTKIIASAPYAWWVERGQRTFTGHWYMQGATDLARQRLPDKIRMELNYLITQES